MTRKIDEAGVLVTMYNGSEDRFQTLGSSRLDRLGMCLPGHWNPSNRMTRLVHSIGRCLDRMKQGEGW